MENTPTTNSVENATTSNAENLAPLEGQPTVQAQPEAAHQTGEGSTQTDPTPSVETQPDNQDEGIPQKWVGKSLDDILKANKELEKKMHQQSEELSRYRKEQEARSERPDPAVQPVPPQVQEVSPPVQNVKSMEDWLREEFTKDWGEDPAAAVQRDRQRRDQWRTYQDNYNKQYEFGQAAQAGKVPGMEDFNELLPTMRTVAKDIAPFINPVYETHPVLLQYAYYIAKGITSSDKIKKVATAKTQITKAVEQEKASASAEASSANEPAPTVDPWSMKTEDLKKLLGTVDRSVEG